VSEGPARFHPPDGFREVASALEEAGFQAWAVGGAVRDELLGDVRADWDVATDARPADVRGVFRRTVPLGVEYGTVGVLASDGNLYEVTTFRLDVETDGRHAVVEFAGSVDEDLARRDFTINAVAWRPMTGELRDPFGGRDDMTAGILRAVGEPRKRFAEDYLRVLRGLRFAGRFGLELDPPTRAALVEATRFLEDLSAERVREELMKVLGGPRPSETLRLYAEMGAFEVWFQELASVTRDDPRWEETLAATGRIGPHRPLLRLVRLLLALPRGEVDAGQETVEGMLRRLKFSNADIRRASHLYRHYLPLVHPADSSARLREWLAEVGVEHARDLFRLHFASCRALGSTESAQALVYVWSRVHEELLASPPLSLRQLEVNGDDLIELGLPKGPLIGLMLEELHAQVLEAPHLNEREALLERARELIELGGLDRQGS
jgi:tRNA nucleotidyltransferase (CCA-adding enzyme)